MRDYYSEEIENSAPQKDYFTEEIIKNKPEPTENLLQRMSKAAVKPFMPDAFGKSGMNQALQTSGMAPIMGAYGARGELLNEIKDPVGRFATDVATDPLTWMGGKAVGKAAKEVGGALVKPSSYYGKVLDKSPSKVDFLEIISKHSDDPVVKKVLDKSGVIEKYGGTSLGEGGSVTEKLRNLSARDSQNLINDLKVGQNKGFLSGDVIKSNQIGLSEFFRDLSKAQNAAVKGLKGAKKLYGISKAGSKLVKSTAGKFTTGASLGAGAKSVFNLFQ